MRTFCFFFFQAEDCIRDLSVTGVQTCALPISRPACAQGQPVGTAQNAVGTLVIVRTDGIEHRLQGKGSLPLYEGDVLRTEPASQALIQLRPGTPVALNEKTTVK